jgi:uncharacterized protein YggT (Ycf19 family)
MDIAFSHATMSLLATTGLDIAKLPWAVVCIPTEPFLAATRKVVPLVGGVDMTPIVWVALISFLNEILLGPQGILILLQKQNVL